MTALEFAALSIEDRVYVLRDAAVKARNAYTKGQLHDGANIIADAYEAGAAAMLRVLEEARRK